MKELKFKSYSSIKSVEANKEAESVKFSGWASRMRDDNGNIIPDYDDELVDTSGFNLKAKTLLYMHRHDEPIGRVELRHKDGGIYYQAELFKDLHEKAYFSVLNKVLTEVSIGFVATEWEFEEVEGESYVKFTKGDVVELSLVSVGSNKLNTIDQVKSIVKDNKCTGLSCSIKSLKDMNPDCECLKEQKETNVKNKLKDTFDKALTFSETENESWMQHQLLEHYFRVFYNTIDDNWYDGIWNQEISADEIKQNIIDSIASFEEKLMMAFEARITNDNQDITKTKSLDNTQSKTVITYNNAHKGTVKTAPIGTAWSGSAEIAKADVEDLKVMCAWYDSEKPEIKGSYKFPHHRQSDKAVVFKALVAAMGRLNQADIPDSERKGVYNHIAKHYKDDFDREAPDYKSFMEMTEKDFKDMIKKETEPKEEQPVEETPVDTEENPTEEVQEEPTTETESKTEAPKEPVEEPKKEEPKEGKPVETPIEEKPTEEAPKEESKEEAVPEKEPEPVNTIQTLIGTLSTFSLDNIETEEELEALDEQIDSLRNKLDAFYAEVVDEANQIIGENENEA